MATDKEINPGFQPENHAETPFSEAGKIETPDFKVSGELTHEDIPQVEPLEEPKLVANSGEGEAVLEILPEQVNSELDQKAKEENLLDMLNGEVGEDKSAAWEEIEGLSQIQ